MKKQNAHPPQWIQRLIERYCEPYLFEGISGDLEELFVENVNTKGPGRAKILYLLQAFGFFRMRFKKNSKYSTNMKAIWTNYLITSFRSLKRHKTFFAINLLGLITAITCAIYALVFINDELQFDKNVSVSDNIFRLYKRHINEAENVDHLTWETSGMMGPTIVEEFPEATEFTRVLPWWDKILVTHEKTSIMLENPHFADSNFFDFWGENLVLGNPENVLKAPLSIALSEERAHALFGDENPLGKSIIGLGDHDYTVTGVFKAPSRQSSFKYDAIISWSTTVPDVGPLRMNYMNNWLSQGIFTFVRLSDPDQSEALVKKLPEMMERHFQERADHYFLKLFPFSKMYLHGEHIRAGREMNAGSITFVYTLGFSALLVFLIASVNYINIMLSRAAETKTEVGIRKVMGSSKNQLMGRFVAETFISTVIASIVSYGILLWLLESLNMVTGKEIPLNAFFEPIIILSLLGFIFLICIIVGVYPAFVLSSPPVSTIFQGGNTVASTGWLRKGLLTFQYVISVFLIVCTITVIQQIQYLKNKPLGFDKENVIVINTRNEVRNQVGVLEQEFLKHPNILSVSASSSAIGAGNYSTTTIPEGYTDELVTRIFGVDQEFMETFGIQLISGRNFLKGSEADSNNLIVNNEMVEFMGWEDPIGKHIRFQPDGESYPIIGVVDNFHYNSLASTTIEPMVMYLATTANSNVSVRIGNGNVKETIDYMSSVWDDLADRTPFDFIFVDQWFNEHYQKETQLLQMASTYSLISIILCALGLYGLTAMLLSQKQKELSIRKVLGASVNSIIYLVNKQFLMVILIAFICASPLAFYLIDDWLERFVYKVSVDPLTFLLAGGLTLGISVTIISLLSVKTANTNPSKILSQE